MSDKGNTPAFPCDYINGPNSGMTLHDYYVGQAIVGLLASGWNSPDMVAVKAREVGDAVLAERECRK